MNIAIFSDSFLPGCGGTENATKFLATELTNNGHNVVVCCPSYCRKNNDNFCFKVIRAKSIKLTSNDYYAYPNLTKNFKKKLDAFSPDIIHCQSVSPMTAYALKYAKKKNIPTIMTVHTKFKTSFQHSIKSKAIVSLLIKDIVKKLNKASCVCSVCNSMANELHEYGFNGEVKVIRNGSNTEKFDTNKDLSNIKEQYGISKNDSVLLFVGHIVKFKNIQFIIDSLKILKQKNMNFKMLFVGDGFDFEHFKKQVKIAELEDNAIFTGRISDRSVLSSLYGISDLFLFPSIFDNDPLVLIEAATHCVPALTLAGTGASERITDGQNGFISQNDPKEYAECISQILQDKKKLKAAGKLAQKEIPTTWKETTEQYLKIYNELLKNS